MSVDVKSIALPAFQTGTFTSAGSPALVTETIGYQPSLVILYAATAATNPNMFVKAAIDPTKTMKTNGADGVVTSPADASGILITATGFTVAAAAQTASGLNMWIAFR